jgi:hypothetical protein
MYKGIKKFKKFKFVENNYYLFNFIKILLLPKLFMLFIFLDNPLIIAKQLLKITISPSKNKKSHIFKQS